MRPIYAVPRPLFWSGQYVRVVITRQIGKIILVSTKNGEHSYRLLGVDEWFAEHELCPIAHNHQPL